MPVDEFENFCVTRLQPSYSSCSAEAVDLYVDLREREARLKNHVRLSEEVKDARRRLEAVGKRCDERPLGDMRRVGMEGLAVYKSYRLACGEKLPEFCYAEHDISPPEFGTLTLATLLNHASEDILQIIHKHRQMS